MEVKNSSLCLFDKPPVQTDFLNNQVVDYYPLTDVGSGNPLEFTVPGTGDDYIDPNGIQLFIRAKVTEADGKTAITPDHKAGPINLPLASFFSDAYLHLGESQIEGGSAMYAYRAYFHTVLQFQPEAQRSHMVASGWYKDEAGKFDNETNLGFKKRSALIANSKSFELMGPLHFNFCRQGQLLLSQTDMRIKLIPSKQEFALMAFGGKGDMRIIFEEVILYVPRYTLNPSVINGHSMGLKKQNAIYPELYDDITTFTIPKGQSSFTKDRLFPDQAPKLLVVAMTENAAFNGSLTKNPFHFQHFNLKRLALYRDSVSVPGRPFQPDFAKGLYLRSYVQTMNALNYFNTDDTNGLTPSEFANGYTLYAFDLTADGQLNAAHRQPITSKNLRLELGFEKELPNTINVVLYAVYDSAIEITQLRDVITHYTR